MAAAVADGAGGFVPDGVGVPIGSGEQVPDAVGRRVAEAFGHLPADLPLDAGQRAADGPGGPVPGPGAGEGPAAAAGDGIDLVRPASDFVRRRSSRHGSPSPDTPGETILATPAVGLRQAAGGRSSR